MSIGIGVMGVVAGVQNTVEWQRVERWCWSDLLAFQSTRPRGARQLLL